MKILFTVSYYYPYISGLTIHVQRLAESLVNRGHSIEVLTTQHQKNLLIKDVQNKVAITRVPYIFKLSKGFFMPGYILTAINRIKEADILVINLPQAEGFIPAFFGKLMGKKVISIYHCEVTLSKSIPNFFFNKLLHFFNFITLFLSDRVITYTKDYAHYSRILPHFSQKLTFIYPPVPMPKVNLKITWKDKIPNRKYKIGVAARIATEKGIEYLFEAILYLEKKLGNDLCFLIAGPEKPVGEEKYWEEILPLIKKYKDNIVFLGSVNSEQMGSFYNLLDLLVLPSVNSTEAFGMVQVEAMLCGIPVVASDLPGVRIPIQETGMGEITSPGNSKDLADKIIKVLINKKKYVKNKKYIEKIFNFDDTILKYEKLFSSFDDISIGK